MTSSYPAVRIQRVQSDQDLESAISLFKCYAQSLGIDLTFQDFETEMASMPGKYAPPTGCLLLARATDNEAVGCAGLRPLSSTTCEMKRLWVDPRGRGLGVGRALAEAVIREAKRLGYNAVLLDTLPSMSSARALYESLGFVETEKYYDTPLKDTVFLRLDLHLVSADGERC